MGHIEPRRATFCLFAARFGYDMVQPLDSAARTFWTHGHRSTMKDSIWRQKLNIIAICSVAVALLLFSSSGEAETVADERARVALVLSGGGARGGAHVGVLKGLEQLRVPVDAIAGTSMGAVVGGLYASGVNATELEKLLGNIDWRKAFDDDVSRRYRSFRRRQDDQELLVKATVGVRDGSLRIPRGLIQGQNLDSILRDAAGAAEGVNEFDALPIPFRALATDLVSGDAYIFRGGSLVTAMRASMSVPGVFEPVALEDKLLVDGGLVSNLPVEALNELRYDAVIAVDVSDQLLPAEQLESAVDVTNQMLTILLRRQTRESLSGLASAGADNHVIVTPDLAGYSSSDFANVLDTVEAGERAVLAMAEALSRFSIAPDSYQQYRAELIPGAPIERRPQQVVYPDGTVKLVEANTEFDAQDQVNTLYGTGRYSQVSYRWEDSGDTLVLEATEKPWGPNYLRFGLSLEDDFSGNSDFSLAFRYTQTGFERLGTEWRTDLRIGGAPSLATEFYRPLSVGAAPFFVAARAAVGQRDLTRADGSRSLQRFRITEYWGSLAFGQELGRSAEWRMGVRVGSGQGELKLGAADPAFGDEFDIDRGDIFLGFELDTLDQIAFPRSGDFLRVEWAQAQSGLSADDGAERLEFNWTHARSFGSATVLANIDYRTALEPGSGLADLYALGGFLNISGIERDRLAGRHRGLAQLIGYRRLGDTGGGLFDLPWYVGASLEAGNVWQARSDIGADDLITGGSLFTGLDTFFGPVYLALGLAEGGETTLYLFLGQPFRR